MVITGINDPSAFERFLYGCFPNLLLKNSPWERQWNLQERQENISLWRIIFPLVSIAYVAHYFFLDRPLGLTPPELWFQYRFSLAGLSFAAFLFYLVPTFYESRYYRVPAYLVCWAFSYWQARSMVWYEGTLYLYAFAFVVISVVLLRTSLLKSLVFATAILATQYPAFLESDVSRPLIYSATVVSLLFVVILRSKYLNDIKYFLAVQENTQAQKHVIELSIDFNDRIRALLPAEISRRLTYYLTQRRLSVLQAMDEVLQPQRKQICALFSDIRGFTEGTKDLERFIGYGVLPNVRQCTAAVEANKGIPRKIGDLIFAYFDDANRYVNLIRCVRAGIGMANVNEAFNKRNPRGVQIQRHILLATGESIVGNLGGMDSSIEITALGSPVNLLSRVDELTKAPGLQEQLDRQCLILCPTTAAMLKELSNSVRLERIDLSELNLSVRNFESVDELFLLNVDADTERLFDAANEFIEAKYHDAYSLPN